MEPTLRAILAISGRVSKGNFSSLIDDVALIHTLAKQGLEGNNVIQASSREEAGKIVDGDLDLIR